MKNHRKLEILNFKKLNHRIIRAKSNAFLKLILHAEQSPDNSMSADRSQSNLELLIDLLSQAKRSFDHQTKAAAFEKIKLADWKLIPEVYSQLQEDSLAVSRVSQGKMSQSIPTILPLSSIILRDITNLPHFGTSQSTRKSNVSLIQSQINIKEKLSRKDTIDTTHDYQQQLRNRKRALIIKKLENVEMSLDYIQFQSQAYTHTQNSVSLKKIVTGTKIMPKLR